MQFLGHARDLPTAQGRAIVLDEANSVEPSKGELEKMARRRFQEPEPKRAGRWWYLLYWQDEFENGRRIRKRKRVKLALATMPEREVKKIAAEHLRPLNQGLVTVGSATKFEDYVESVYRPTVMPLMAKSTRDRYESVIKHHLVPAFGQSCLRDLTPLTVQRYLSGMAESELSHESRDKIRDVLSSILNSAVKYGHLVKNPVEGLQLPPPKSGKRLKPYVTPTLFLALLALIPEPYATMVFVAIYSGLRASELIALRWRNIHEDSITIAEEFCRGEWGAPKSEASNATIPVNREVIQRIQRLKTLTVEVRAGRAVRKYPAVKSAEPDDLVFQSPVKGMPMRDNNVLVRYIKPAARKLGIGWVNWQVLRRSFATWLKMVGADVKDAQGLMRHSRASTTMDVYTQFVPESQRKVVEDLGRLMQPAVMNPICSEKAVPLLFQ
jgi:integrase